MTFQTLQQIHLSLSEDLKAAEKSVEIVTAALKKSDPDGKSYTSLVEAKKRAVDRACSLRCALDDFNSQEW